jgi:hypothetical protein
LSACKNDQGGGLEQRTAVHEVLQRQSPPGRE